MQSLQHDCQQLLPISPCLQFADMSDIDVHLELPKSITLASVALRVQTRPFDNLYFSCTNEYAAVGGMVVRKLTVPTLPHMLPALHGA